MVALLTMKNEDLNLDGPLTARPTASYMKPTKNCYPSLPLSGPVVSLALFSFAKN